MKEYEALFSKSNSAIETRKELRKMFDRVCAKADEQKAIRVHDYNRRISKNIKDVCESLGIQSVTPQYARNSFISALAHHGVMTAYIDYAVGHATSEVSALLAGYISNVTPAMMQAFNEKIFIVPPI